MATKDPRVDAYIVQAAEFARPILNHLRKLVHAACPDVEETMKWSLPYFMYKGMLCNMAAFKNHCTFGFWKGRLIFGPGKSPQIAPDEAMGQFGRISTVADLPDAKVLLGYIQEAVRINEAGLKIPGKPRPKTHKKLAVPEYFKAALKKNRKALATFEDFSYSHKKEYVEWVTEAKREETRQQRLATAIKWMAQGKSRHWKYE